MEENGGRDAGAAGSGREGSLAGKRGQAMPSTAVDGGDLLLRFLDQLSRFGLAAGGEPLLKPAKPQVG